MRRDVLLNILLGVLVSCVVPPVDFHGKSCQSNEACGQGLVCASGVCADPLDGGVDGGADSGSDAGADAGCEVINAPGTCVIDAGIRGASCTPGTCQLQDVNHCSGACLACPGAAASCSGNKCVLVCDGGMSCGVAGCRTTCPPWYAEYIAGDSDGGLEPGSLVTALLSLDAVNLVGVGRRPDAGGFVIQTSVAGEPWTSTAEIPVGLNAVDFLPGSAAPGYAVGAEGGIFLYNPGWTCINSPTRAELIGVQIRTTAVFAIDRNTLWTKFFSGGGWQPRTIGNNAVRAVAFSPSGQLGALVGRQLLQLNELSGGNLAWTDYSDAGIWPGGFTGVDLFGAWRGDVEGSLEPFFVWGDAHIDGGALQGVVLYGDGARPTQPLSAVLLPPGLGSIHDAALSFSSVTGGEVWAMADAKATLCPLTRTATVADAGCSTSQFDGGLLSVASSLLTSGRTAWLSQASTGIVSTTTGGR